MSDKRTCRRLSLYFTNGAADTLLLEAHDTFVDHTAKSPWMVVRRREPNETLVIRKETLSYYRLVSFEVEAQQPTALTLELANEAAEIERELDLL